MPPTGRSVRSRSRMLAASSLTAATGHHGRFRYENRSRVRFLFGEAALTPSGSSEALEKKGREGEYTSGYRRAPSLSFPAMLRSRVVLGPLTPRGDYITAVALPLFAQLLPR